jgi:hypothetical protein
LHIFERPIEINATIFARVAPTKDFKFAGFLIKLVVTTSDIPEER